MYPGVNPEPISSKAPHESKVRLLHAALTVIRAKGYAATTVEDICLKAGVTKGSFFHHFETKDQLALTAVAHWGVLTERFFEAAPYHAAKDPLDRLLGYLDFRTAILTGSLSEYTCLLGTLVQETYDTHPEIREACYRGLSSHIAELTHDLEEAKKHHAPTSTWSAESVGYFIQSVIQGSFVFAKAMQSPKVVRENLAHLRRYLGMLFGQAPNNLAATGGFGHPGAE
jgi:TetR/AcrR family transcriptional repressor of nem operon